MVNPNQVNSYRDDEVKPADDDRLKRVTPPSRDFREVAEQVDERRYREKEELKKKINKGLSGNEDSKDKEKEKEDKPVSLFDLAGSLIKDSTEDKGQDEAATLASIKKARSGKKPVPENPHLFDSMMAKPLKDDSQFLREQPDLPAVNTLGQASPVVALDANIKVNQPTPLPSTSMQEIIDRITKEVYTLEKNGNTDTVITLKGPMFDKAHLILSEFSTAPGQFNITFDNLTQSAKNLLDLNRNTLIEDLSKKGYMVHIVTNTTTNEITQTDTSNVRDGRDERQNGEQNQGGRQGRDQDDQER